MFLENRAQNSKVRENYFPGFREVLRVQKVLSMFWRKLTQNKQAQGSMPEVDKGIVEDRKGKEAVTENTLLSENK